MTPKEKATELFEKFLSKVGTNCEHDSYCDNPKCKYDNRIVCCVDLHTAKQCALICVDEILSLSKNDITKGMYISVTLTDEIYWGEVKTEIEKL